MKLKKTFKLLSSIVLFLSFTHAFAADVTCPMPEKIRMSGSNFLYAYNSSNYTWTLVSESFSWNANDWQTTFTLDLPNVVDPATALEMGQQFFNKSPLLTQPLLTIADNKTGCNYTPGSANYKVVAFTPAGYGIKQH